jgi:hypothetical protein
MLIVILFLSTVVGVNWFFCYSLFQETVSLLDSTSDRTKISTHNLSGT